MKNKRTLVLVSGILFILAAVSYIIAVVIFSSIIESAIMPFVEQDFADLIEVGEMTAEYAKNLTSLLRTVLWVIVGVFTVSFVIDLVLGILLIKHSKTSDEVFASKKGIIITSLVFAFLSAGVVTAILLIVTLCIKEKPEEVVKVSTTTVNSDNVNVTSANSTENSTKEFSVTPTVISNEQIKESYVNDKYAAKIKRIQNLRDSGAITKEEYETLLKQIFED